MLIPERITGIPRVCVCALARSGTSMLMRMLEFGGLRVDYSLQHNEDEIRFTYRNPHGFFEDSELINNNIFVNSFKLFNVCKFESVPSDYKIIFLRRSLAEISASWENVARRCQSIGLVGDHMPLHPAEELKKWEDVLSRRNGILTLEYNSICTDPSGNAERIAQLIDTDSFKFNVRKSISAVDNSLYLDRREVTKTHGN